MLKKSETDSNNQQHWTLYVPDEHCITGLEVSVVATVPGLLIGGQIIGWGDLEQARKCAQKDIPF